MAWLRLSLAEAETENPHKFTKSSTCPATGSATDNTTQILCSKFYILVYLSFTPLSLNTHTHTPLSRLRWLIHVLELSMKNMTKCSEVIQIAGSFTNFFKNMAKIIHNCYFLKQVVQTIHLNVFKIPQWLGCARFPEIVWCARKLSV